MDSKDIVNQIFQAGIGSVLPDKMVQKTLKLEGNILCISDLEIPLSSLDHIYVIGAGKASALMAQAVENILGDTITGGHVIVKHGHDCLLSYVQLTEAGHPVPDSYGFQGTQVLKELLEQAEEKDLVICLLSGGGSALLADYPEGASPEDLIMLNQLLLTCGADIHEMNTVRKHLSEVKGGQLAKAVYPAALISLILSDVIGDSLDIIASGPTSPDSSTFSEAWSVLEKYELIDKIPPVLKSYLQKGLEGRIAETPKEGDQVFDKVYNLIIGSNTIALEAAKKKSEKLGIYAEILTSTLGGDAEAAAGMIADMAIKKQKELKKGEKICLLFGGETTVKVTGDGLGGRNQHLALCASRFLEGKNGITLLSAGTDGSDGPTDAAGAVVDGETRKKASDNNINSNHYQEEFDSYHFFKEVGGHVITGSTLTNVMDLIVVLIENK